ncbi:hypothetical protein DFQ26_002717 [Actinomortierella ambigua]|nr:hypothetical protein DFQ26_002717 [Actinomortierella ambigua]
MNLKLNISLVIAFVFVGQVYVASEVLGYTDNLGVEHRKENPKESHTVKAINGCNMDAALNRDHEWCLAVVAQAAPCMSDWPEAGIHHPLSYEDHTTIINGDDTQTRGALIIGEKVHSEADLVNEMQRLISTSMQFRNDPGMYHAAFLYYLCDYNSCSVKPLSAPAIEVIPVAQLTSEIVCADNTCTIGGFITATVSTVDPTFPYADSRPFHVAVKFNSPDQYTFSDWRVQTMQVNYHFALNKGEKGYVAMVNAQISEKVQLTGTLCRTPNWGCSIPPGPQPVTVGHHQAVIMDARTNKPVSIVAFVHT